MNKILIELNGERQEIARGSSVVDLLTITGADRRHVAVVVNERVVRPEERPGLILEENDRVDILVFAGGG
jgi:sulfur carrier protein